MSLIVKTDYLPEEAKAYLTEGKEYKAVILNKSIGLLLLTDDTGDDINCLLEGCFHLSGRNWTVVSGYKAY
jgi:hypothetical protein